MMRMGWQSGLRLLFVCAAAWTIAGCGNDQNANVTLPGQQPVILPAVTGTVFAPNGEFAAISPWRKWLAELVLIPRAYAGIAIEEPVASEQEVSLSSVSNADAAHAVNGYIQSSTLIGVARNDLVGRFKIVMDPPLDINASHLMVAVGAASPEPLLTRGFVFQQNTDLDAVSEALVRLVLKRLTQAPAIQLSDFTNDQLAQIYAEVEQASRRAGADGTPIDTVAQINNEAYRLAANDNGVQAAIAAVQPRR